MNMHKCRICGNFDNNFSFEDEEKMFGTREKLLYFECSACHCIQICEIPYELSEFYPEGYFSLNLPSPNIFKKYIKRKCFQHSAGNHNLLGKFISSKKGNASFNVWLKHLRINFNSSILDAGSG